jgi:hypothetical protein
MSSRGVCKSGDLVTHVAARQRSKNVLVWLRPTRGVFGEVDSPPAAA